MGKGDKPRPLSVSYKQYSDNYEAIFGKKDTTDCDSLGADIEQELEAEKRIDIIGRNGNDGLHYDEVNGES